LRNQRAALIELYAGDRETERIAVADAKSEELLVEAQDRFGFLD